MRGHQPLSPTDQSQSRQGPSSDRWTKAREAWRSTARAPSGACGHSRTPARAPGAGQAQHHGAPFEGSGQVGTSGRRCRGDRAGVGCVPAARALASSRPPVPVVTAERRWVVGGASGLRTAIVQAPWRTGRSRCGDEPPSERCVLLHRDVQRQSTGSPHPVLPLSPTKALTPREKHKPVTGGGDRTSRRREPASGAAPAGGLASGTGGTALGAHGTARRDRLGAPGERQAAVGVVGEGQVLHGQRLGPVLP